jgi:PAS domain S-box-containing protein
MSDGTQISPTPGVPEDSHKERQIAEEQRARLAAIVDSSEDAIVGKTLDGIITSWNRGAERIFGYGADEAIGQHISFIIPPDRLSEEAYVLARLRRGERIEHFETMRVTKDGRRIDISLTVSPIKNLQGHIIGASKVGRDITERKRAEAALARSRQRYRRIFETAAVSTWEQDFTLVKSAIDALKAEGVRDFRAYFAEHPKFVDQCIRLVKIVDVNETTLRMFGASGKNELLDSLTNIFVPETHDVFAGELLAIAEGKTRFEAEAVLRTLRGQLLDALVTLTFPEPDEPFESVVATITDITARKRAEQSLRDSESLFHEMADTAPAMLWITDSGGTCTFLSRRWYEFSGHRTEARLDFPWWEAVHPDDRTAAARAFRSAHVRRERFQLEYRVRRAEGDYRWVMNDGQPRLNERAEFLGFIGAVVDITERRVAEDAIKEEVQILETLAGVGASLAAELDPDKLVQAVTDAGTRLTTAEFGAFYYNIVDESGDDYVLYTLSGAPKEAFAQFPKPRAAQLFGATFRGEGVVRIDDITKDPRHGQSAPYGMPPDHVTVRSYLAVPVTSPSGEVLGGLFFGHKHPGVFQATHEQLAAGIASWAALALDNARLYQVAQDANRAKDEFLATLSHELRNPLNAMLGWSQVLRSSALPQQTQRRALEALERNARAQVTLIEDLLDVSRIVSGKLQIRSDDVDLTAVVTGAVDTIRPSALAKGVALRVLVDTDVGLIVTGDDDRLRQIVWNLLSNAVKFTPKGGRIETELRPSDPIVEIIVKDTGQGISKDFLPHIFERFRQADTSAARRHGGLGLGLAVVRHLAEAHGGSALAESPGPGQGSTFIVRLPLRAVRGRPPAASATEPIVGSQLASLQVLVVDDEPDARDLLRVVLQAQGAEVIVAESAGEALLVLQERQIDVLLADIGMPDQDGYSLIQAVRAREPGQRNRIPAIAVTAYAGARERARALEAGYGWHLAKPVDPEQLVALVAEAAVSHGWRSAP